MRVRVEKKVSLGAALMLLCTTAQADVALGLSRWSADVSGTVRAVGEELDLRRDLHVDADAISRLTWRRGPLQLGFSSLAFAGSGQITRPTTFGGLQLGEDTATVVTRSRLADLSTRYLWTLYPGVQAGATLRSLSGYVDVSDGSSREIRQFSETVPQIAAAVCWPQRRRVQISAAGDWISYAGDALWEWRAQLSWKADAWGAWAGYAAQRYRLSGDTDELDARLDGVFIGAEVRW